jgi:uncharacterized membrane protein
MLKQGNLTAKPSIFNEVLFNNVISIIKRQGSGDIHAAVFCQRASMADLPRNSLRRNISLLVIFSLLAAFLLWLPTGYEKRLEQQSVRCIGRVLDVDNSEIRQYGLVKTGDQTVRLELVNGPFKGRVIEGNNPLLGIMHRDKIFSVGDRVFVVLSLSEDSEQIVFVNPQDFYRLDLEVALLVAFVLALILFGGWIGAKALMSFILSALMI